MRAAPAFAWGLPFVAKGRIMYPMLSDSWRHSKNKMGVFLMYRKNAWKALAEGEKAQLDAFAGDLYDRLFRDEAHFLVVFQEHNGAYNTRYVCGLEARAVMDDEACEILLDYLDAYYFGDYDDEEYFSKAFTDAADRIMDTKIPTRVYVTGAAVVIGIGVLVWLVWKKLRDRREERVRNAEAAGPESPPDLTSELLENADAQTRFPGNEEE